MASIRERQRGNRGAWAAFVVALVMCLTNAIEPLTVDDVCHHYYAAQVAAAPLRPFDFEVLWHQKPVPAWDVMVAPVQSYWWAPAIALFGESPVAWKLWFFPLHWLFCASLLACLQRFVPRQAALAMAAIALGPTVLPGINLMLELPMLAFAFAGTALLLRAFEQRGERFALLAGLALGLALQTKYSAMAFAPTWLLLGFLRSRRRETLTALSAAAATALTIEGLLALSHDGSSYFLRQLTTTQTRDWAHLVRGMLLHTGLLAMPAALVGLAALGAPRWLRGLLLVGYGTGHTIIAGVPDADGRGLIDGAADSIAYLAMATLTWLSLLAIFARLGWSAVCAQRRGRFGAAAATRAFLCLWFGAEIAMSFLMSPFPAARRTLMVVAVATIAAAYLAACTRQLRLLREGALGAVLLGLAYQGIDVLESRAPVAAAAEAQRFARQVAPGAGVWFSGGWGFEFHAPRHGMAPLLRGQSRVKKGDLVCVGSIDGSEEPWFEWHPDLERIGEVAAGDAVPLSLQLGYYCGRRPLDGQVGPRFVVWIYRARRDLGAGAFVTKVNPWRDH
jgi:hypothetical protein